MLLTRRRRRTRAGLQAQAAQAAVEAAAAAGQDLEEQRVGQVADGELFLGGGAGAFCGGEGGGERGGAVSGGCGLRAHTHHSSHPYFFLLRIGGCRERALQERLALQREVGRGSARGRLANGAGGLLLLSQAEWKWCDNEGLRFIGERERLPRLLLQEAQTAAR
jgi:hypothetical protein